MMFFLLFRSMLLSLIVPIDVVVDCSDRYWCWTLLLIVLVDIVVIAVVVAMDIKYKK